MTADKVFLAATAAFGDVRDAAMAENRAAYARIMAALEFSRLCEREDALQWDPQAPTWVDFGSGAQTELCMMLGVSPVAVGRDLALAEALDGRFKIVNAAFAAGELPLNKVRVILDLLIEVDEATAAAVEGAAVTAARYKAPAALGRHIMGLLIKANPEEAARLRKRREQHSRKVTITPSTHGMATILAKLTAVEGREAAAAIDAMAATVCDCDPRTQDVNTLIADAFMAILRGDRQLQCRCGREEHCPYAYYQAPDRTTTTVVHLHVNPETLLGLVDDPANLTGHGPIDPDLARDLAADGTWRIVVDYARTVRDAARAEAAAKAAAEATDAAEDGAATDDSDSTTETHRRTTPFNPDDVNDDPTATERKEHDTDTHNDTTDFLGDPAAESAGEDSTAQDGDPTADPHEAPTAAAGAPVTTRRLRNPGLLPGGLVKPSRVFTLDELWGHLPIGTARPVDADDRVAQVLARIAADPSLLHSDGHGGYSEPPKGALTYKSSKKLREQVLPRYATCTAPGCLVPWWKCEFDHAIEYDWTNPLQGGWTIRENGSPVCKFHNLAKAAGLFRVVILDDGAVVWISLHGVIGVSLPVDLNTGGETPPPAAPAPDAEHAQVPTPPQPPTDAPVYEPTWWETTMHPSDRPPSASEIAAVDDPEHRGDFEYLRDRYRDHLGILAARQHHAPVPF